MKSAGQAADFFLRLVALMRLNAARICDSSTEGSEYSDNSAKIARIDCMAWASAAFKEVA
jgi:hypothetical protein